MRILVLGANGRIARWVVDELGERPDVKQTLLVRHAYKLRDAPGTPTSSRATCSTPSCCTASPRASTSYTRT